MTTLKDLLLELRAIRIGQELFLLARTGRHYNLLDLAALEQGQSVQIPIPKPREPERIIHQSAGQMRARETLKEMGDDTLQIISYIRQTQGDEAADEMMRFYEKEIIGKGGSGR